MKHPALEDRLATYESLIREWAPRLDLVSPGDLDRLRRRHIDDSLRALPIVNAAPPGPCIDVGSGAGLPGLPLAAASTRLWRLLEPRRRRAAFLEECVRALDLDNCEVVAASAEQAAADPALARAHAVATARALAEPPRAAALCRPLIERGGVVVIFVGSDAEILPDSEEAAPGLLTIRVDGYEPG